MGDLTELLGDLAEGDPRSSGLLFTLVYDELRQMAAAKIKHEKPGQTLQATALVHEAYLRLLGNDAGSEWASRGHFFAAAGEAMRRILIEHARTRLALKRGGKHQRIHLDLESFAVAESDKKLLNLNCALDKLESEDEIKAIVVKLRFFAGLTLEETARSLGISKSSVDRYWTFSKAWLQREMSKH